MINFILGGICGIGIMCLLQINRDNKAQRRINKAIKFVKEHHYLRLNNHKFEGRVLTGDADELLKILGGDVDE